MSPSLSQGSFSGVADNDPTAVYDDEDWRLWRPRSHESEPWALRPFGTTTSAESIGIYEEAMGLAAAFVTNCSNNAIISPHYSSAKADSE